MYDAKCVPIVFFGGGVFKLSFLCKADWAEEGIFLLFLFVFVSRRLVFIARAKCWLLNVTVAALCISSVQQQCDQSSEHRYSWKRGAVFNSAMCTHNPEI